MRKMKNDSRRIIPNIKSEQNTMTCKRQIKIHDDWPVIIQIRLKTNGYACRVDVARHRECLLNILSDALRKQYDASQIEIV